MNSFADEMLYRGVLFGPLLRQVTTNQAISMTAVLFGIARIITERPRDFRARGSRSSPAGSSASPWWKHEVSCYRGSCILSRTRSSSSTALSKIDTLAPLNVPVHASVFFQAAAASYPHNAMETF